jgi:2-methylcitrate dehydratase PrpD
MRVESAYWCEILDYFYDFPLSDVDDNAMHQLKRSLLDYLGCVVYAAAHDKCHGLVETILSLGSGTGTASVWASDRKASPGIAAFANATRTSNIELDDGSGMGASVHPGVYVWSAALAAWEDRRTPISEVLKAALFGYDVCSRMGLLATGKVRELGLHGPGLIGGLGAVATAGKLYGLTKEQLRHAFNIASTLLPLCPFVSFIQGADAKDLYGGWGVHLAFFAVEAARRGLTGPLGVLDGPKSLASLLDGEKGKDVKPGTHFYISNVAFKQYSACYSVHPAMSVVTDLTRKHNIDPSEIAEVAVATYPYSYDLSAGVRYPLNPSSGRLSLNYTVAYALYNGELPPSAFDECSLKDERYFELGKRIKVTRHNEYGEGPFGVRGCKISITMRDGTVYSGEAHGARWATPPSDEDLTGKFLSLTSGALPEDKIERLRSIAFGVDRLDSLDELTSILREVSLTR